MRPNCLQPDACVAKSDTHCRSCATIARNKTARQRAVAASQARVHAVLQRPDVIARRLHPEVIAKAERKRAETVGFTFNPDTCGNSPRNARRKAPAMTHEPGTVEKVRSMCGYISDDAAIAKYMGITERDVARIRLNAPKGQRCLGAPRKPVVGEAGPENNETVLTALEAANRGHVALILAYYRRHHPNSRLAQMAMAA